MKKTSLILIVSILFSLITIPSAYASPELSVYENFDFYNGEYNNNSGTLPNGWTANSGANVVIKSSNFDSLYKNNMFVYNTDSATVAKRAVNAEIDLSKKYIFSFAGGIVSWLISATLYFAAKIVHGTQLDVISELPVIVTFLPIIILMAAFMIPMQIKFGVEKSRAVVAGICGAIGACILIFAKFAGQNGKNIFAFLDHMNGWGIVGIGIVLTAVITAISYIISVKIMKKKEF